MKVSVSEDIEVDGSTIKELIKMLQKLESRVGSDATVDLYESYGSVESKIEYYREETGPERSNRMHKELTRVERRRQKYFELKKEFGPTSGEH